MSGPGGPGPGPTPSMPQRSMSTSSATPSMPHPPQSAVPQPPAQSSGQAGGSNQNLNQIVIEYLNKKGYNKTEQTLRAEMAHVDAQGRMLYDRLEDRGGAKYNLAYKILLNWIDETLEIYRVELRRLKWPVFVYCYLGLISEHYSDLAATFLADMKGPFQQERAQDLQDLSSVSHREHLDDNSTAKAYNNNRYRLTLTQASYFSLLQFLESKERDGGSVILGIINNNMRIVSIDRAAAGGDRSLAALLAKKDEGSDMPAEDEGIPGHNPGSANTDPNAPPVLTKVSLGEMPMDQDLAGDVRDELDEEDLRHPPGAGANSLIDEFEQKIKRESSEDAPSRDAIPLPKPLARDVAMEVQRIKDHRDRFRIEPKSGGIGPGVSVTMFTLHNTFDSVNCVDFSGDNKLLAVGTAESYIRVWSLEGKSLPAQYGGQPTASRRLIGHSGPVYGVSFSPSIASDRAEEDELTSCKWLLSCSADKSVRLWSLETWSNLVVYKGHDQPVWDVTWGPYGHYFLTGSHDNTARMWSTDHVAPLRIFAGHDEDVDCVAFHPNNAYVFSGSSDRTVRMWDVNRGSAVRMFTGHTAHITALSCSPSGRTLASGDESGAIMIWDLSSGRLVKRMRGHGKGGVWSLAWSVESSLLVSGGADNTVRVWDIMKQQEGSAGVKAVGEAGTKADGTTAGATTMSSAVRKTKGKDATVTLDQISAFPTKKTPVYKVKFTSMNLVLAGGAYMP